MRCGSLSDGVRAHGRRELRPAADLRHGAPLLEIFLFDFSGDLYGETIEVAFVGWIRGEEKFDGLEALVERMNEDARIARAMLAAPDHRCAGASALSAASALL